MRTICVSLAILSTAGCQKAPAPASPPKPVTVEFVTPVVASVTPFEEFGGKTAAAETVELRSRVTGYLRRVNFVDGADVHAGDVLFEVEDATYLAELDEAEAMVKQRTADVQRLRTELQRLERLKKSEATTQQEIDRLTFETDAAEAALAASAALRDQAKLNLDFTKVIAPISGRIGRRLVDPGNLVQADSTPLALIVSLDPIYAYFEYDERSVLAMRRMVEDGRLKAAPDREQPVLISLAGEDRYDLTGTINWVDNQLDMATGTLRARVAVPNAGGLLSPGMFVRLRVPLGPAQPSLLIPEQALGTDQGQRFVYVVSPSDEIENRRVEVGWLEEGKRVVTSGLNAGDRVVMTGLQRIKAQSKVTAKPWVPPDSQPPANGTGESAPGESAPGETVPTTAPAPNEPASRISPSATDSPSTGKTSEP